MEALRVIFSRMKHIFRSGKLLVPLVTALVLVASLLLPGLPPVPNVRASTDVGGDITSDTTWTQANSPYIVTASVLVSEGVTLTIEPGVTVKFEGDKALGIDGELIARGTEANPIVFTSNQATPAAGDWANIVFTDTSVDATYDAEGNYLSGSIMQYCTVEYGGGGNTPAIKIVSSSPFVDHCTIRSNGSSGIYVDQGSLTITNCTISSNSASSGGGIYADGGTVTISNCTVSNNSADNGGGIYAWDATVTNCTISNNSASWGGGIYAWDATVSNCTVSNNSASESGGIYADGGTVSNCTISNNSASWQGGGISAWGETTISHNWITGNHKGSGVHVAGGAAAY